MGISLRRVNALVKKETKDFLKNINVSLTCILPLVIVLIFSNIQPWNLDSGFPKFELLRMGVDFNLIFICVFAISMLIAEEKEKNTLRTLMLSSVSPAEFLLGKAIVISSLTLIFNIIIYIFVGMDIQYLGHYVVWSTLVIMVLIQIGGIIGLIAQNQINTGVLGIPVILVFLIIPLLAKASDLMGKVALLLPNHNFYVMIAQILNGEGYANLGSNIVIIFVWVILAAIAFAYTYRKNKLD